jgi:hypothetical protein
MKYAFFIFLFFSFEVLLAQENTKNQDTLSVELRDLFIKDFRNRLNIKLVLSNEDKNYDVLVDNKKAIIAPNIGLRYALNLNYRFLSISLGIRSKPSEKSRENKGESKVKDYSVSLLFDKWSQKFQYYSVQGFYIKNGEDLFPEFTPGNRYVQLPELKSIAYYGATSYQLNNNYSIRATQSQTEVQLKSAGSFLPSSEYWLYSLEGMNKIKINEEEVEERNVYSDYFGFNMIFNIGYHYTFVIKKWYAHLYLGPGMGADFYKETKHTDGAVSKENYTDLIFSVKGKMGIGYNSKKIFFGIEYTNRFTNNKLNSGNLLIQTNSNSFFAFFGYRFRAPKAISTPVKYIEKKIPILE